LNPRTNEYENTLRRLIINIIGADDNSDYKISEERIIKWKEKREIEIKKNKGLSFENRILYYSDFYDLKTIINKNWNLFLPILNNKKRFEIFYKELENYRNTKAHGRNLTRSQNLLLEGILIDLKNSITIYHNKNEMKEDFFIRIVKMNDNLGNIWDPNLKGKKPFLRVGDNYELIVEANDPKDRVISYRIFTLGLGLNINQESNRFNIKLENKLVGENTHLYVQAITPSSEYKNEATKVITITVLPKE
jgi:hypothetical protein